MSISRWISSMMCGTYSVASGSASGRPSPIRSVSSRYSAAISAARSPDGFPAATAAV